MWQAVRCRMPGVLLSSRSNHYHTGNTIPPFRPAIWCPRAVARSTRQSGNLQESSQEGRKEVGKRLPGAFTGGEVAHSTLAWIWKLMEQKPSKSGGGLSFQVIIRRNPKPTMTALKDIIIQTAGNTHRAVTCFYMHYLIQSSQHKLKGTHFYYLSPSGR